MGIRDPGVDLQGVAPTSYKWGYNPHKKGCNPHLNILKAIYRDYINPFRTSRGP